MVFLLAYAVAIWAITLVYRRRWPAFAAIPLSVAPVAVGAKLCVVYLIERDGPAVPVYVLAGGYGALIVLVGLLIAVQPRRIPAVHPCPACGYDLLGNVSGVCSECGLNLNKPRGGELLWPAKRPRVERTSAPVTPAAPLGSQLASSESSRARKRASSQVSTSTMAAPTSATRAATSQ